MILFFSRHGVIYLWCFINAQRIHQPFLLHTKGNLVNCVKVRSLSITLNAITTVACFISLLAEYINVTKLRFENTGVLKALLSVFIYKYAITHIIDLYIMLTIGNCVFI